jgi:uncharacterized protein (TIGR02145 family)
MIITRINIAGLLAVFFVAMCLCSACKEDSVVPEDPTPDPVPEPVYHAPDTTVIVDFDVFNPPAGLPAGSLWKLRDKRDNKTYKVKLMEDKNYWMVQDLRYGGATDACANKQTLNGGQFKNYFQDIHTNRFGTDTYGECRCGKESGRGYYYDWPAAMQSPWAYSYCPLKYPKGTWCTVGTGEQAHEVQGICPAGWHLPAAYDFVQLDKALNGSDKGVERTGDETSLNTWNEKFEIHGVNGYASGTDMFGIGWDDPTYGWTGGENDFWTSSWNEYGEGRWAYNIVLSRITVISTGNVTIRIAPTVPTALKSFGLNVRCLRNTERPADPPPAPVDPTLPFIDQLAGIWEASEVFSILNLNGNNYFDNTHEVTLEKVDNTTLRAINMTDGNNITGTQIGSDTVLFRVNVANHTLEPFFQELVPSWHPYYRTYFAVPGSNCEGEGVTYKPLPVTEENNRLTIAFPNYGTVRLPQSNLTLPLTYQIKAVPLDPAEVICNGILSEPMSTVWRKK